MLNTRAPIELSARILDFCRSISSEQPIVMKVEHLSFAVPSECYSNVEEQVLRSGGSAVYGWQIWDWPAALTEAEFHAVWRDPNGSLHEITPKVDGDQVIVFLPDPSRTYQGRRIDSIRHAASANQILADFIHLCEATFRRFGQTPSGTALEGKEADLYKSSEMARTFMVDVINNGANRNAACLCGSGERYKRCHEHKLRRLIDGLFSI
ncbi:YecA family protein [Pseudomonas sivasensis]|uniref:YecA family protein n=1 Tax=Pseudomonas sivasensis TaxID=1880678 RepID=UPI0030DD358F